jgi:hypothetical protein
MRANNSAASSTDAGKQAYVPKCSKMGCELLVNWVAKEPSTSRTKAAIEQLCPECSQLFAAFIHSHENLKKS